jgi:dTDP-L-rhamnose 4-epimerase
MSKTIFITGGAGFIGSHLADALLTEGYRIRVFDSLEAQSHGSERGRPLYLDADVELIEGNVRDRELVAKCLKGATAVCYFAAAVSVG